MAMTTSRTTARRLVAGLAALATAATGLVLAAPASADTVPTDPGEPATVSVDPLPTVQINGVVWDQAVVGGRVYAVGEFTRARPAGAAAGTSEVTRTNVLAYDLATGVLVPSFAPSVNAQVRTVDGSPDGRTVYIGGDFTSVGGQTRNRVAAFDVASGALLGFNPSVNGRVNAIDVKASGVYLGGAFSVVSGQSRTRVAAVSPAGAVLGFRATVPDGEVRGVVLSPDGSSVVIGGGFTSVNGSADPGFGLARLDATSGANKSFPVNSVIRSAGPGRAIYGMDGDAQGVYGVSYGYNTSQPKYEGTFAADWDGNLRWLEDCHGDSYDVFTQGQVTYKAGHPYRCNTIGGVPQNADRTNYFGFAFTNFATGTVGRNTQSGYAGFEGRPAPSQLTWFPTFTPGTYTGQSQAGWTVEGNGQYVLYGGEFTHINGTRQQGLVRFAVREIAPNKVGPTLKGAAINPTLESFVPGSVHVRWPGNDDRDNERLTYRLYRGSTLVSEQTVDAPFYRTQAGGAVDRGLPPGSTQSYRLTVSDPFGNTATSQTVSGTVASGTVGTYASRVLADRPRSYWRLGEDSGTAVRDWAGIDDGLAAAGVTRGGPDAVRDTDGSSQFSGTSSGWVSTKLAQQAPDTFTVEGWFRTTSTTGGKIVGFGSSSTGGSASTDRQVYLDNSGRVVFGVYPGAVRTVVSPGGYRDGRWHHVAASLGAGGMRLMVDGAVVASRTDTTSGQSYRGFWRIGGDSIGTAWTNRPTSQYLAGTIDEVAVYDRVLTTAEVAAHVQAATGTGNAAPLASFTASTSGLTASVDGGGSTDPDGSVTAWAWDFGDGATASGRTASHAYATAGTRAVTLTVTDDRGATASTTRQVTTTAPAPDGVVARDAFGRSVGSGWGAAEVGGPWTVNSTTKTSVDGSVGVIAATPGSTLEATLQGATATSSRVSVVVGSDAVPTGGGAQVRVLARAVSPSAYYGAQVKISATGAVQLYVTKDNGTLVNGVTVPGLVYAAGDRLNVVVETQGTSPTTVRAKVWRVGTSEPSAWTAQMTDASAGLQAPGFTGLRVYLTSTAVANRFTFDDLSVTQLP
ncbi:LamG-like jellyroll fold domain-containing protein [Cellulomonas endophytica]|uniref:LamG-like jellyroll fold domain-containing protein n=1 Tax=Cellulomonas endophytica TaxID=2494735 RepID=UPI0010125857|nr:LamG-like jellyroll fold domain-containing protein [Cellulomonas endophytica]